MTLLQQRPPVRVQQHLQRQRRGPVLRLSQKLAVRRA
jgi:hypothetical protein